MIVVTSAACGQTSPAQSLAIAQAGDASAAPAFDVAAIRQNNADHTARSHIISSPSDGNFRAINVRLKAILQFAFGISETQILGGPAWIDSTKFDIEAKADSSVDDRMRALGSVAAKRQKQVMLQALLADRFHLAAHEETRQLPIYVLVVAKNGPKFKESKANGTTINSGNGYIAVQGSDNTLALLAQQLAQILGRVVVNKTEMQGRYDLTLKWTPDELFGPNAVSPDSGPSLFTAIQEQLGLKLEAQRGPVQIIVIDHIEMPSEN
jgi:uncharacterized protein (TIGR03435 family)